MKQPINIITHLSITLLFLVYHSASFAANKQSLTFIELINTLNKDYVLIHNRLEELQNKIKGFPETTISISLKCKESQMDIAAVEVWEGDILLQNHIYSPQETRVIKSGANHLIYKNEMKSGTHVLKVVYFWDSTPKLQKPFKGNSMINLRIAEGKKYSVQLNCNIRGKSLELNKKIFVFKD